MADDAGRNRLEDRQRSLGGKEERGDRLDDAEALDAILRFDVDGNSQTSVANIYAVGDCTDRLNLTPVAIREGHGFANLVYGGPALTCEYEVVPAAVFSQPPVAAVGLTEEAARASVGEIDVYRTQFRPLKHTITGRNERAFMKLVVARDSQAVLGAHMVGADAPEIMQGIAIAVRAKLTRSSSTPPWASIRRRRRSS